MATQQPAMELVEPEEMDKPTGRAKRIHVAHVVEPDSVFSREWLSWQFRTLNLGNFALLITLLVVSENIGNTLRRQEAQNAIATQYLLQAQLLLADSNAQMNILGQETAALNASLVTGTIETEQKFSLVNTTMSYFYDFVDKLHLNDSLLFIQSKTDAIATLENVTSDLNDKMAIAAPQARSAYEQTDAFFGANWQPWSLTAVVPEGGTAPDLNPFFAQFQRVGNRCFLHAHAVLGAYFAGVGTSPVWIPLPPNCSAPGYSQSVGFYTVGTYSSLPNPTVMSGSLWVDSNSDYVRVFRFTYGGPNAGQITPSSSIYFWVDGSMVVDN